MSRLRWNERLRVAHVCAGESRTVQSHKDTSDVNYIVNRYQRTGQLPSNPRGQEPQYTDVTHLQGELTEAFNDAQERSAAAMEEINESRRKAREKAQEEQREFQDWKKRKSEPPASGGASPDSPQPPGSPAPPDSGG